MKTRCNTMKKITTLFLVGLLVFGAGCNEEKPDNGGNTPTDKEEVVLEKENGYFVKNGVSDYKIVVPSDCAVNVSYAAEQLQLYVLQSTDCRLPIVSDVEVSTAEEKIISLEKTFYQEAANLSVDYTSMQSGGFFLKNVNGWYFIDSATQEGLLYGVYDFLNLFFGVEFLTGDYTYIERATDVKAYDIDYVNIPTFVIRDYLADTFATYTHGIQFAAKMKMNTSSPWTAASASINGLDTNPYYAHYYVDTNGTVTKTSSEGHTIQFLLANDAYEQGYNPTPLYATTSGGARSEFPYGYLGVNRDWYAWNPAHNRANSLGYCQEEICYTNGLDANGKYIPQEDGISESEMSVTTKIIQIVKEMILDSRNKNAVYLMLGHADYSSKCLCDDCLAAYEKYGTFSGATIAWVNEVIRNIKEWQAATGNSKEVKYVILAYDKSIDAPVVKNADGTYKVKHPNCQPDKDIIVKMAYRNCCYHSLWDESCTQNDILRRQFTEWSSLVDKFAIWDYTCNYNDLLWYLPNFGTIKDNYLYYQKIGVQHLISQGSPNEYNFYESHLHTWVSCKLMWNPYQDVNRLIERFNELYFGEYASYVNTYRDIFENHFAILDETKENGFHAHSANSLDFKAKENYTLALLERASNVIQEAIEKVRTDESLDAFTKEELELKLRGVQVTPQYMMLQLGLIPNDDAKKRKEVATTFFESIDMLDLSYFAEGSTAEHTFETMREKYGV